MTELEVPNAARSQMDSLGYILEDQSEVDAWIRAIATPMIVAHLRRMAGDMELPTDAARLRRNADLLEGGAS